SVCQVSTGEGVVHQIVCGAKNHKEGDKIIVALPGANLPNGMNITATKLRGVDSGGMLCSEKELGLSSESSGLLILPSDAKVGLDFSKYYNLDDVFFELKVTPNRADCLSHFGLAREVSCILAKPLRSPFQTPALSKESTQKMISLSVSNGDLCPRFTGRYVRGVKVGDSPGWLKQRLEALGLNSINNIVDVTNYVMLETGQPLHAYDVEYLEGDEIRVATSNKGESFTSLDGTKYTLDGSELMIYDAKKPVGMAGVVGGKNSGVSETTKDIFIECAYFVPQTVRRSSRKHGIETDSGYRFSRGVDPTANAKVLDRATELILKVAGGEAYTDIHDFYPTPITKSTITIDTDFVSQKMGINVDEQKLSSWLTRLGCKVDSTGKTFTVVPPSFRVDLNIAEDLVEEYARLEGYDKIPANPPNVSGEPTPHVKSYELLSSIREKLSLYGICEALNYAFTNEARQKLFLGDEKLLEEVGLATVSEPVKILNPLSEDFNVLRTSVIYSLFNNLCLNYRRGNLSGKLFELGQVFKKGSQGYVQSQRLAFVFWGKDENLWKTSNHLNVFALKANIENLFLQMGLTDWEWKQVSRGPSFLHPGQTAQLLVQGKPYGVIGSIHPKLKVDEKIRADVAFAEFDIENISQYFIKQIKATPLVAYPAVERDLAFVCDKTVAAGEVEKYILSHFSEFVVQIKVFDAFEGGNLSEEKKSLGFRLLIQDKNKTMSEEQLLELQSKIMDAVKVKFNAEVR
ncbi:MAG: phenylalanine--tRNA ligase subunit beta, partial [Bdellovibrionales bacterium]|nr:phenylalanine--tRNA ligase subunit beta [Bdellovibrionales bacterium]